MVRNLLCASALAMFAVPALAAQDFSSEIVVVTDLGGGDYSFIQRGYSEGAFVEGTFSGMDNDANLQLSSFDGELTALSISFSGNSIVPTFSLGMADIFGLVYDFDGDIGDGLTLAVEGIGLADANYLYSAGPGPFAVCDGLQDCGVVESFGEVPSPAPLALLGLGAGFLLTARRRTA